LKTAAAAAAAAPAKGTATAPAQQQRPSTIQRPAAAPAAPSAIKPLDKALIYTAAVAGLVGVGFNVYVFWFFLKPAIENFQP
jgi:hypothetical protein